MHQISSPKRPLIMLSKLRGALRQLRPHVVLAAQFDDLLHGATAGRFCNALTLGSIRSDGLRELKAHGWLSPWMVRLANGLIANSYGARHNFISRGVNSQKIEIGRASC